MRIPRLYVPQALPLEETIVLDLEASHHVGTVLRLRKGHTLCLFNGEPYEYQGIITTQSPKKITVQIQKRTSKNQACPLAIHLGQSIVKGHKMDFVMQKATELGVQCITPLLTERCMSLDSERLEKKQAHWQKILIHAAEQCGRTEIPTLKEPIRLCTWIDQRTENTRLLLDPQASRGIEQKMMIDSAALLIGPEGGLSSTEKDYAIDKGFEGLQLGPRILRTETAALAALVALQCRAGDFRL
ncbi:MAG: 16S rRNA (uracil(1498)-N(3))-methyltransferase [Gammaproteobacteria bacterium]|nr:16S rRNA (uracil(1498)-N(3))-methyltransferase [Gammaproteobacteria bacterium]